MVDSLGILSIPKDRPKGEGAMTGGSPRWDRLRYIKRVGSTGKGGRRRNDAPSAPTASYAWVYLPAILKSLDLC
jgi:hypothetical protein